MVKMEDYASRNWIDRYLWQRCITQDCGIGPLIFLSSYYSLSSKKNLSNCVHPCPYGYYGDTQKPCTCAHALVTKYQKRVSGPLLDRIDIHIEVPRVDAEKLSGDRGGESSEAIRARVQVARNFQHARVTNPDARLSNNGSSTDIVCNADMRVGEIRQFCKLPKEGQSLICAAMSQLNLFIGAGLSSYLESGAHDFRFSRV